MPRPLLLSPGNLRRAKSAGVSVRSFAKRTGCHEEAQLIQVSDFLCNLQHWCAMMGVSFEEALSLGNYHYEAEKNGDDD